MYRAFDPSGTRSCCLLKVKWRLILHSPFVSVRVLRIENLHHRINPEKRFSLAGLCLMVCREGSFFFFRDRLLDCPFVSSDVLQIKKLHHSIRREKSFSVAVRCACWSTGEGSQFYTIYRTDVDLESLAFPVRHDSKAPFWKTKAKQKSISLRQSL